MRAVRSQQPPGRLNWAAAGPNTARDSDRLRSGPVTRDVTRDVTGYDVDACAWCGGPVDRTVRPRSAYCSARCRYAARDARPEVKARQRDAKRDQYRHDPAARDRILARQAAHYRETRRAAGAAERRVSEAPATIETSTDALALKVPLPGLSTGPTDRPTGSQPIDAQKGSQQ